MKFKLIKINKIEKNEYKGMMHDLTVETNHSYTAFNIIVSNSICSTRLNCGVGVPQFSAILDCAQRKSTARLISCGGLKHNGDIAKAIAAGADLVMTGKMLASTDLAGGECYDMNKEFCTSYNGVANQTYYKEYRGMASREARSGVLNYGSVEGAAGLIRYTGKTEDFLNDVKLNMQATLSYCGVRNWNDFKRKVKIVRQTQAAIYESQTHVEE